jgi:hypothetical protein
MKVQKFLQPLIVLYFPNLNEKTSASECVFRAVISCGRNVSILWFFAETFSHKKGATSPNYKPNVFIRSSFSPHTSSTFLIEESEESCCQFFVEQPRSLLFEYVIDDVSCLDVGIP